MPVSTEAHHTNVRLNPSFRQGENLARQALGGRRICCVLRCRAPVDANLVSKGKTLPYCSIFVRIPSEMAVLPEAHQQMADLTQASAWAPIWREGRWNAARLLHIARLGF